ncbi:MULTISPECIES: YigZ family protein [Vibrio]|uniref:YigZ family protein n=1 Tax=Vibrio casei TaxID=673372 RepID=A0A368LK15_9VIBR|nr:YigZ family protein [Vibrio casei]RCS72240.1 YigZ family protein [Vibrio casei]SJN39915.1 protein co-occurring with transport systems (COG1739) [Vibrio casei]
MNEQPYLIPIDRVIFEEEIKKSLFITHIAHTPTIEIAKAFVDEIKTQHASARHNCWGFVAGRPEDSLLWGFSDDGEPSGTAGKPILAQLSGSGIGEMTAVVTRYSGGIKLGTGGLVKAYGGGVQQALKQVQTIEKKITTQLQLGLDYSLMPLVQSIMAQYQAAQLDGNFGQRIDLLVEIDIREADVFTQTLVNKTGAKVEIKPKHM